MSRAGALLLILLVASFSTLGVAAPSTWKGLPSVVCPLYIEGTPLGDTVVYPNPSSPSETGIDSSNLIALVSPLISPSLKQSLRRHLQRRDVIPLSELRPLGITGTFDETSLSLIIELPAADRETHHIVLSDNAVERSARARSAFHSGHITLRPSQSFDDTGSGYERGTLASHIEAVENIGGVILETNQSYTDAVPSQGRTRWKRDDTRMIIDHAPSRLRFTGGDIDPQTTGLQTPVAGAGFSLNQLYSLHSTSLLQSQSPYRLVLKRPSTLEVFLNGAMVKKTNLPAGPVDISNFPYASGENDVVIRVTDDRGQHDDIRFDQLYHPSLLGKGQREFNIDVSAPPIDTDDYNRHYDTSLWNANLFFRQGITSTWTLGPFAQVARKGFLLGPEWRYHHATGLYHIGLGGLHRSDASDSGAARIEWTSLERANENTSPWTFRSSIETHTSQYRPLPDLSAQALRYHVDADVYASRRFPWSMSMGSGVGYRDSIDHHDQRRFMADLTQSFSREWQAGINYSAQWDDRHDETVMVSITWTEQSGRSQIYTTHNRPSETTSIQGQSTVNVLDSDFRTLAGITTSPSGEAVNASIDMTSERWESMIDHTSNFPNRPSIRDHHTRLSGGMSVAWADTSVTLGRPVGDAFAIVSTSPHLPSHDIPIGKSGTSSRACITPWFPALVTDIRPDNDDLLTMDIGQLPFGTSLAKEDVIVHPDYKSGIAVNLDLITRISLSVDLKDAEQRPFSLHTGRIMKGQRELAPFFTNKMGRVFVEGLDPGRYTLILDDDHYRAMTITIPKNAPPIYTRPPIIFERRKP